MNSFHTKIVGSTFCGGQEIIKTLKVDDVLKLIRDPDNQYDPNAVGVHLMKESTRIGYIPKDTAITIAPLLDEGITVHAIVAEITGQASGNVGCNLGIYYE